MPLCAKNKVGCFIDEGEFIRGVYKSAINNVSKIGDFSPTCILQVMRGFKKNPFDTISSGSFTF